jgi:hypothetical protein
MSTRSPATAAPASPFRALLAQAQRRPHADALRAKRRGTWQVHSWAALARAATDAAHGWAAAGVVAGDTIVAVGPLSSAFIVTLFAAQALGASVAVAQPLAEERLLTNARFVFAEGTHELERVLRYRSAALGELVLADADAAADTDPVAGLRLQSLDTLLLTGREHASRELPDLAPVADIVRVHADDGTSRAMSGERGRAASFSGADESVLADFDTTWLVGLSYLVHTWPRASSRLLIPEPLGNPVTDRREAAANIWLAPTERLAEFAQQLAARVPSTGLGGRIARAVLAGRTTWFGSVARARIRAGQGLRKVHAVLSDPDVAESTRPLLLALGIDPVSALKIAAAQTPERAAVSAPRAEAPGLAAALAGTAS